MSMTQRQADLLTYWLISYGDKPLGFTRLFDLKRAVFPQYPPTGLYEFQDISNSILKAQGLVDTEQELYTITDKAKKLLQEMTNEQRIDSGTADK